MKTLRLLIAVSAVFCCSGMKNHSDLLSLSLTPRKFQTQLNHPSISGFVYAGGETTKRLTKSSYGYFYFDSDYYYAQMTNVSRLYLIHVRTNFTPASIAVKNDDEKGFDSHYDLWSGYIHILPFSRMESTFKKSSSFRYIKSWPVSSSESMTCEVSSAYSTSYSFSSGLEAGANLNEGAYIKSSSASSLTLGFSSSTTIHGKEPGISHQEKDSNSNQAQWSYQFHSPYTGSYERNCYYLMEVKNDAIAYQNYSFGYQVDIKMTNTAWEIFAWKQHKDTINRFADVCGL